MSVTKSCRVTEVMSDRLGAAAEESERLEGELVREAIRFYVTRNPEGYAAFDGYGASTRRDTSANDTAKGLGDRVYDPIGEE